jgi:hypothetical protein
MSFRAAQYDVTREVVQLENGYWDVMAKPVQAVYIQHKSTAVFTSAAEIQQLAHALEQIASPA